MRSLASIVIASLLLLGGVTHAGAQGFQGGVRGAVKDANGVIPGVTVTLTNEETNVAREVTTNEVGEYVFAAVAPGTYTLRAAVTGFKAHESKGLRVGTQQFLTVDIALELGGLEETITVASEAPLIETSNASTGEVLERKELEALPAPGRAAFLIGVTVPTVVASGDAQFNRQQDQTNASLVSLGGGARRANNYIVDGVPISDMRNRAVANPSMEGLEEVKVQVHTFDAEMGRTGGGTFNVTARSGTNNFRGSGFFQTRPVWGLANNYFNEKAGIPKLKDQYYRLYGGAIGGPVIKDRAFFHFATEGYRSVTTRNGSLIFPTDLERAGNFSQSFDRNGNLLVIHDPITRQPFPGNIIPANRIDPVGQAIVNYAPKPDQQVSNQTANYRRTASIQDAADQFIWKGDGKFSNKVSLSGLYLYNKTDEPYNVYWDTNLFQDPSNAPLLRRIHVLALNNTWLPNDTTVATFRYGWTRFDDNCGIDVSKFDVKTLPFDPSFTNDIAFSKHPQLNINDFGEIGINEWGTAEYTQIRWKSWGFNGAVSKLLGTHTLKFGADYRNIGVDTQPFGQGSGEFTFTRRFTASDAGVGGSPLASLLLGTPVSGYADISTFSQYFLNYYGAYAQDDWRVNSNLTINYGLRYEYESGLGEQNDQFTVGFDRNAVSPLNGRVPGLNLKGGLMYAGVDGNKTTQGDPPAAKLSPRVGFVYSMNPRTVLRGGYGVYWAPWNYQFPGTTNYGNVGFAQSTTMQQSSDTGAPTTFLRNPFPNGLTQPRGSSLGLLTGVGGNIDVIDQDKGAPYVQQLSVDLQRELGNNMAVSVTVMHARGDDLGFGGTVDGVVNINQIPQDVARNYTPAQLNESVPNPFFGVAGAGGFASRATIQRGQLLRPYPQFGDINLRQVTGAKSRYNAVVMKFDKRLSGGWGGRFNYTYSSLKDSQFGETNHFQSNTTGRPQDNYNLDDEYATSLLDSPHRIVLAPIVELPFGQGKKWANSSGLADAIIGGWSITAVALFESGFPTPVRVSGAASQNLLGNFGNVWLRAGYTGTDPNTAGSDEERVGSATPWANRAGYVQPAAGTYADVERTDTRLRSPFRRNFDVVFNKAIRTGGSTRAEIRFEMLNITNTAKFRDYNTFIDNGTFGQITRQSGFSRITQISFRFTF